MTGTPFFASPEMLTHKAYSYQQDIWSLGVTMYQFASLSLPYNGDTIEKISKEQRNKVLTRIPMPFSKALKNIIEDMMAKEPKMRPTPR